MIKKQNIKIPDFINYLQLSHPKVTQTVSVFSLNKPQGPLLI